MAICLGPLEDSRQQALHLRPPRRITVAGPRYPAGVPEPARVEDLDEHHAVLLVAPRAGRAPALTGPRQGPVPAAPGGTRPAARPGHPPQADLKGRAGRVFDLTVAELIAEGRRVDVLARLRAPGPPLQVPCLPGRARKPPCAGTLDPAREAFGAPAAA